MTLVLEVGPEGGLIVPADVLPATPGTRFEWRWEGESFVLEPEAVAQRKRCEALGRVLDATAALAADGEEPPYELIQAEIDAYRAEQRALRHAQSGA